MDDPTPSPAFEALLAGANEFITIAKQFKAEGDDGSAIAAVLFANEWLRAARAVRDLEAAGQ